MIPGQGWFDFDPTRDTLAPDYVLLGRGADYDDVAPLAGSLLGSGGYRLSSEVTVEELLPG
jgi:transglutaminase-like putative cysteine protease